MLEEHIKEALDIVRTGHWPNGVPKIKARVRVAINSLLSQDRLLFQKEAASVIALVTAENNETIKKIFLETPVDALALAIREATNTIPKAVPF